ncbi:MAG: phosphatidate cytidylyltransferase [Clostridia bacterium]|nr:phosphatidate cytidylyltransferase [Clostridia bacterium]
MIKRVITGAALAVIMILGVCLQGWPLRLLLLVCMLMSLSEMYRAFRKIGHDPVRWVGYTYCVLAVLSQSFYAHFHASRLFSAISPSMLALVIGLLLAFTVIIIKGKVAFESMVSTIFPMLYPGLFFSLILTLQDLDTRFASTLAMLFAFFLASVNDVFALFVGITFGKHRLSPEISPKKSIEGSIGGLAASVVFSMAIPVLMMKIAPFIPVLAVDIGKIVYPPIWAFGIFGLVAGALSQIGDLVASLVKRHCGIKDFGTIFPGHGGMMDRMDGILFCGVTCYVFFKAMGM